MTLQHPWIVGLLLAASVALSLSCAVGVLVMRDAYQRLHFTTPVAVAVATFVAVAIWIENASPQMRIKATLIVVTLGAMNSVLCHVTARALRLRDVEHWPIEPGDGVVDVATHPAEASS